MAKRGIATEIVGDTKPRYKCDRHDIVTEDFNRFQAHLREVDHAVAFGNYPCPLCNKQVTVVPDYIDKPAPDSGLPKDNTDTVHKKFLMVKKRPTMAQVQGKLAPCDDCKTKLREQLG